MVTMLKVVIGIVFILLLLSLLATTIMELIASMFSLRGRNLEKALRNMLASTDVHRKVFEDFKENSFYRQLTPSPGRKWSRPSYLAADDFQSILFDVVLKGDGMDKLEEKIEQLPDADLKNVLRQLLRDAEYRLDYFKGEVKNWFNAVMDRSAGWYKRNTQKILVVIGFVIAILFNADTIALYSRLESDPEALAQVITLADAFVQRSQALEQAAAPATASPSPADSLLPEEPSSTFQPAAPSPGPSSLSIEEYVTGQYQLTDPQAIAEMQQLILQKLQTAASPLGLGWGGVRIEEMTWYDWVLKFLGWTVTALSVTLGAPFWFDLLKRLVAIRGSGAKPGE